MAATSSNLGAIDEMDLEIINQIYFDDWAPNNTANNSTVAASANERLPNIPYNTIFSLGTKEFSLNNSGTKRLVIGISCVRVPDLSIKFRLHDLNNNRHIEFSKKSWVQLMASKALIRRLISQNINGPVFSNRHLIVEVETYNSHGSGLLSITDESSSTIMIANETFEQFISLETEINNLCLTLMGNIQNVSRRIKLFIDTVFLQIKKHNNIDQVSANNINVNTDLNAMVADTWQKLGQFLPNENINHIN